MTSKEKKGFSEWLAAHAFGKEDERALKQLWEMTDSYQESYRPDVEEGLSALKKRMELGASPSGKVVRLNPASKLLRIAAVAAVLIVSGLALKNYLARPVPETVATAEGTHKSVPLADGTIVTLNQNSRLTFPPAFNGSKRKVQLEGEAFFEVAPDATKPFVLETEKVAVTVLGTSFNVRSMPGEPSVHVFVKSGKVEVQLKATGKTYQLTPGDLLTWPDKSQEAQPVKVADENPIGWKQGTLKFREAPLNQILADIQRQFGVAFDLKNGARLTCPFTISFEKENLRGALDAIEASCPLHFGKAVNGTIPVTGQCCE